MSIEHEPKLLVGWRVKQDDIPDYEDRCDGEWLELVELSHEASMMLGRHVYVEDLCDVEDSWCGDTQMVGVPMFDHEVRMGEFEKRTGELAELAKDVYRQVMRKEPDDGPWLISWMQVS